MIVDPIAEAGAFVSLLPFDGITVPWYHRAVIKSFRDKDAERIFNRFFSRHLPPDIQRTALRRLLYLHAAKDLRDLSTPPSVRLEPLSGDRKAQYSLRINDRWRICFEWIGQDAYNVEIVDYH